MPSFVVHAKIMTISTTAVKCNDDKMLVRTLAAMGAGFDCASKAEIQLVMDMGVKAE